MFFYWHRKMMQMLMFHVESMSRMCVLFLVTCLYFLFYVLVWSPAWVSPSTFLFPLSWVTRKKIVQFNHQLDLVHCTSWWENAHINHFGCQPEVFGCQSPKHSNHNFPIGNHVNLLIHGFSSPWIAINELQQMVVTYEFSSSGGGCS
jgi:hypothetical protein